MVSEPAIARSSPSATRELVYKTAEDNSEDSIDDENREIEE